MRECEVFDGTKETCGHCQLGYIEFDGPSFREKLPPCIEIAKLSWVEYNETYEPIYNTDENVSIRLRLLKDSARVASVNNLMNEEATYTLGLTPFSADGEEEYKQRSGYFHVDSQLSAFEPPTTANADLPQIVDWHAAGVVTAVKNQGRCAASWAISACGAIEGSGYQGVSRVSSISFQQMISCNKRNLGCDGGNTAIAVKYAANNWYGGIATWIQYPFTDEEGMTSETCLLTSLTPAPPLTVDSAVVVGGLDIAMTFDKRLETFKLALKQKPISVILKSSCQLLSNYVSGILNEDGGCACSSSHCYDHSVLMVGYNDEAENPHFTFKNSWGTDWGDGGYFHVSQKESGDYGLFGIFGEGIMVDADPNPKYTFSLLRVEDQVVVEEESGSEMSWRWALPIWAIVIIALCPAVVACAACMWVVIAAEP
eukprot:CAMPEP_0116143434 /NCGR_PEP_ID=MMETSP0329-20121206/15452_1 /TAXON_ID=697910 /ORGANISM="Pseudo-nitzschia arenysensis, Strain B593" /LENGTH=426 /DNA_ID=CAMNT_0003638761 /DNA_START=296 /DNA_END=1577 /DNA_ORIENTATION=+